MTYIVLTVIYIFILNVIATIRLSKSELYEKSQKVFQTILIWVLPLIGAVFVSMLLNQDEPIELKKKNILKSILLFIWIIKIKKDKNKKGYKGYEETESVDEVCNTSYHVLGSDL